MFTFITGTLINLVLLLLLLLIKYVMVIKVMKIKTLIYKFKERDKQRKPPGLHGNEPPVGFFVYLRHFLIILGQSAFTLWSRLLTYIYISYICLFGGLTLSRWWIYHCYIYISVAMQYSIFHKNLSIYEYIFEFLSQFHRVSTGLSVNLSFHYSCRR